MKKYIYDMLKSLDVEELEGVVEGLQEYVGTYNNIIDDIYKIIGVLKDKDDTDGFLTLEDIDEDELVQYFLTRQIFDSGYTPVGKLDDKGQLMVVFEK